MRPLSDTTIGLYDRVIARAYGDRTTGYLSGLETSEPEINTWPESTRALLRAAIVRRLREGGWTAENATAHVTKIIPQRVVAGIKRAARFLTEDEAVAYERVARELPRGRREIALLPLATGLRAEELLTLARDSVKRAAKTSDLLVVRKGGEEQVLHLPNAATLFEGLLGAVRSAGRF